MFDLAYIKNEIRKRLNITEANISDTELTNIINDAYKDICVKAKCSEVTKIYSVNSTIRAKRLNGVMFNAIRVGNVLLGDVAEQLMPFVEMVRAYQVGLARQNRDIEENINPLESVVAYQEYFQAGAGRQYETPSEIIDLLSSVIAYEAALV